MQEMPLLIFTVLSQTAAGALATIVVLQLMGRIKESKSAATSGWVVFGISLVGMCASLVHLGQPMRAMNAIQNLGSSPLSFEILCAGLFTLCSLVYAILMQAKKDGAGKVVGVIGAIVGLVLVGATSACYMLPGVPAWNGIQTPAQFYLTVIACGIPLALALTSTLEKSGKAGIWWAVFAVLFISQIVMRWFYYSDIVTLLAATIG